MVSTVTPIEVNLEVVVTWKVDVVDVLCSNKRYSYMLHIRMWTIVMMEIPFIKVLVMTSCIQVAPVIRLPLELLDTWMRCLNPC